MTIYTESDNEPPDHVLRTPLPWRQDSPLTECGREAGEMKSVIGAAELRRRIERHGDRGAAQLVCRVCLERALHASKWAEDPVGVLGREIQRVGWNTAGRAQLASELQAINALIQEHRSDFDAYLAAVAATVDLAQWRAVRR